jgi:hypothetical protein
VKHHLGLEGEEAAGETLGVGEIGPLITCEVGSEAKAVEERRAAVGLRIKGISLNNSTPVQEP